jgi:hypothetical protein
MRRDALALRGDIRKVDHQRDCERDHEQYRQRQHAGHQGSE